MYFQADGQGKGEGQEVFDKRDMRSNLFKIISFYHCYEETLITLESASNVINKSFNQLVKKKKKQL